jgi:uncharacterized protein DUF6962
MHRYLGRWHGAWVSAGGSINSLRGPMEADSYCHWRDDMGRWGIGRQFIHSVRARKWIERGAILQFCLFSSVILFHSQQFLLAELNYLPAAIFLLIVFLRNYFVTKEKALLFGVVGMTVTFAGSFVEIARISLHPQYFDHNALYHTILFIALCLLFITAQWDVTRVRKI